LRSQPLARHPWENWILGLCAYQVKVKTVVSSAGETLMPPSFAILLLLFLVTAGSIPAGMLLAVPSNQIARRLGYSPKLFTVLSLIPLLNLLFFFVVAILVLLHILDKLNAIDETLRKLDTRL
jgi:hypothetical protein